MVDQTPEEKRIAEREHTLYLQRKDFDAAEKMIEKIYKMGSESLNNYISKLEELRKIEEENSITNPFLLDQKIKIAKYAAARKNKEIEKHVVLSDLLELLNQKN